MQKRNFITGKEESMQLTLEGLKDKAEWEKAGIELPKYDVEAVTKKTRENPAWVHFGIGNIFRIFLGGIEDTLISDGDMDRGITCVETFDYDVVDKVYAPHDNLALSVILHGDGRQDRKVLGSLSEAIKAQSGDPALWNRLMEIARADSLQMMSFTITEKGYALTRPDGTLFPFVEKDIKDGPDHVTGAMGVVTAMLLARYKAGAKPLACVSMDNCSQNGALLRRSVLAMADAWKKEGYVDDGFVAYVNDESKVSFPWTMIDKITPRPSDAVADQLEAAGVEDIRPIVTSRRTYIAPFINAEGPQYLVVEDSFPNGRPPLEKAGVYMTDRDTVNKSERMKVTACLNPIHTALGPYGVVLGYDLFPDELKDPDMHKLAEIVGYKESLPVVPDPKILSPKKFIDECMNERFPNVYLGDTCLRLSTDSSMGLGVRFGVTVQNYVKRDGDAKKLIGIPLAITGWLRYILAVDDEGKPFELAPDPMADEMHEKLSDIVMGDPATLKDQLHDFLSNESVFFINLYDAGIGELIEQMFREEIAGKGAVRATIHKYVSQVEV